MKGAMLRALGLLGLSLSLSACAGVRDVYVSVPHIEGHSENTVQDGSIHLEGLTLVLLPRSQSLDVLFGGRIHL